MVRYAAREYGVRALGVTLSREQAAWAQQAIAEEGLDRPRRGAARATTATSPETEFDAVSSIGLTEHIGVRQLPGLLPVPRGQAAPGGRLLNHCITRPRQPTGADTGGFIDRYVFPDGELIGSGRIITEAQNAGLEVLHEENLRAALRADPAPTGARTSSSTGTSASPRSARAPRGSGGSTWPGSRLGVRAQRRSSCTRCWPSRWTSVAASRTCRCDPGGSRSRRPKQPLRLMRQASRCDVG